MHITQIIPHFKITKFDEGDIVIKKDGISSTGMIVCTGALKLIGAKDKVKIRVML
jgi:hypothetical protein